LNLIQTKSLAAEPREALVVDLTGDGKNDLAIVVHDRILVYPQEKITGSVPANAVCAWAVLQARFASTTNQIPTGHWRAGFHPKLRRTFVSQSPARPIRGLENGCGTSNHQSQSNMP
jgi:hypothetical protein